jgi:hypothetical protein
MGRTIIPSFRIALAMEKEEWKPFCRAVYIYIFFRAMTKFY